MGPSVRADDTRSQDGQDIEKKNGHGVVGWFVTLIHRSRTRRRLRFHSPSGSSLVVQSSHHPRPPKKKKSTSYHNQPFREELSVGLLLPPSEIASLLLYHTLSACHRAIPVNISLETPLLTLPKK